MCFIASQYFCIDSGDDGGECAVVIVFDVNARYAVSVLYDGDDFIERNARCSAIGEYKCMGGVGNSRICFQVDQLCAVYFSKFSVL